MKRIGWTCVITLISLIVTRVLILIFQPSLYSHPCTVPIVDTTDLFQLLSKSCFDYWKYLHLYTIGLFLTVGLFGIVYVVRRFWSGQKTPKHMLYGSMIASLIGIFTLAGFAHSERKSYYEHEFKEYEGLLDRCAAKPCGPLFTEKPDCLRAIVVRTELLDKFDRQKWTENDEDRMLLNWFREKSLYIRSLERFMGEHVYHSSACRGERTKYTGPDMHSVGDHK